MKHLNNYCVDCVKIWQNIAANKFWSGSFVNFIQPQTDPGLLCMLNHECCLLDIYLFDRLHDYPGKIQPRNGVNALTWLVVMHFGSFEYMSVGNKPIKAKVQVSQLIYRLWREQTHHRFEKSLVWNKHFPIHQIPYAPIVVLQRVQTVHLSPQIERRKKEGSLCVT